MDFAISPFEDEALNLSSIRIHPLLKIYENFLNGVSDVFYHWIAFKDICPEAHGLDYRFQPMCQYR